MLIVLKTNIPNHKSIGLFRVHFDKHKRTFTCKTPDCRIGEYKYWCLYVAAVLSWGSQSVWTTAVLSSNTANRVLCCEHPEYYKRKNNFFATYWLSYCVSVDTRLCFAENNHFVFPKAFPYRLVFPLRWKKKPNELRIYKEKYFHLLTFSSKTITLLSINSWKWSPFKNNFSPNLACSQMWKHCEN